jgi:hypothetical protein
MENVLGTVFAMINGKLSHLDPQKRKSSVSEMKCDTKKVIEGAIKP